MRIYYFGELVEDTENSIPKTREEVMQTAFEFSEGERLKKEGMPSVGELLEGLDLNLDVYRPFRRVAR